MDAEPTINEKGMHALISRNNHFHLKHLCMTIFYTFVILLNMKTAVSLPDSIYLEAEETAQNMGITRSALYYKEFEPISKAGLESVRELTKNDTWLSMVG